MAAQHGRIRTTELKNLDERLKQKRKSKHFHQGTFAGHLERAGTATNPHFLRLADLAVAFAGPNGHAEFSRGDLKAFLGVRDGRTVDDAIDKAVSYGLLAKGSHQRCLQIPEVQWVTFAGGGPRDDQDDRRREGCPSCSKCNDPAVCHPSRKRYSSVKNGSLCQQCWRAMKDSHVATTSVDDEEAALLSLLNGPEPEQEFT